MQCHIPEDKIINYTTMETSKQTCYGFLAQIKLC